MRQRIAPIDGSKNDIRLIVSSEGWSDDSGLVDGEPVDPPDQSPGWELVSFWVEYDEEQRTEERDEKGKKVKVITTRKVEPQLHALWVKPKVAPKKAKKLKPRSESKAETTPKPAEPKSPSAPKVAKRRGRPGKNRTPELKVAEDVPKEYLDALCDHTREMLVNVVNVGEGRELSAKDTATYTPLCHACSNQVTQTAEA